MLSFDTPRPQVNLLACRLALCNVLSPSCEEGSPSWRVGSHANSYCISSVSDQLLATIHTPRLFLCFAANY